MRRKLRRGFSWPARRGGDKRHLRPQEVSKLSLILERAEARLRQVLTSRVRRLTPDEIRQYEAEILARPPRVPR